MADAGISEILPEGESLDALWKLVQAHETEDPAALALQWAKTYSAETIRFVTQQIASRQKAKSKLPEWYAVDKVLFPPVKNLEQASSEVTARYKQQLVSGNSMADLTGGSGIDTFYLAHSFKEATLVEPNASLCALARHNFQQLKADIEVLQNSAEDFLSSDTRHWDWLYLDPSRRDAAGRKVFLLEDCTPNVAHLYPQLLGKAQQVLIKLSPMLDIAQAIRAFEDKVAEVHVVSVKNEVKELLFLLDQESHNSPRIKAVDLAVSGAIRYTFSFQVAEEKEASVEIGNPQQFLYEPGAALLKAGGYKSIAQQYGVQKLAPHTHLYTSERAVSDFPGRSFRVLGQTAVQKKALRKYVPEGKANLTTRNFPQSVEVLRKKLQLKEGGTLYLFATTLADGQKVLLVTEKV